MTALIVSFALLIPALAIAIVGLMRHKSRHSPLPYNPERDANEAKVLVFRRESW